MKHLYAPWRSNYVTNNSENKECVFCLPAQTENDGHKFIIKRFNHCFVMLNLYPYNPGHLLVVPYEHTHSLTTLQPATRHEIIDVIAQSMTILEKIINAQGINVGANIGGQAAGGSIPDHVHMHVLPRFLGDTNFLVTLADTKQISANLAQIYTKLSTAFNE